MLVRVLPMVAVLLLGAVQVGYSSAAIAEGQAAGEPSSNQDAAALSSIAQPADGQVTADQALGEQMSGEQAPDGQAPDQEAPDQQAPDEQAPDEQAPAAQDPGTPSTAGQSNSNAGNQTASKQELRNNTPFGDWLFTCEVVTLAQITCQLGQQLTVRDSQQLLLSLVVASGANDGEFLLIAQTPEGVFLPSGLVFSFVGAPESNGQGEMIWQRCEQGLCEAALALGPRELSDFYRYQTMHFGYRPALGAKPIILPVDISEFEGAIRALETARQ